MNTIVNDENGNSYYIESKLSEGGQGCVFFVRGNDNVVIKALVKKETNDIIKNEKTYLEYKKNVRKIISLGEFENLAVPFVMLEKPYCGYIMRFMNGLQKADSLNRVFLYKNKETNVICNPNDVNAKMTYNLSEEEFYYAYNYSGGLLKRIKCLANLAKILYNFEINDIVYCDISTNNVFVSKDPNSFETWLIDLDNLRHSNDNGSPIGTKTYMAPEVFLGKKNTIYSDRYSFALLAYRMLLIKDPFFGNAVDNYSSWDSDDNDDEAFENDIAAGKIAWIFEKNDDSNRPSSGLDPHTFLNEELLDLFEKTFNATGRSKPHTRPSMAEWYDVLIRASESSINANIEYSDESFRELIKNTGKKNYCQNISYISKVEPFKKSKCVNRYIVNIKCIRELIEENENHILIADNDKVIYWDSSDDVSKYSFSNYDISNTFPKKYVRESIIFQKKEKLFSKSNEFVIRCLDKDYEAIAVEKNNIIDVITDFEKTIIYIKHKGKFIKKITFRKEK